MESTILTNAKLQGYRFGCAGQSEWTTSFIVHNGGGGGVQRQAYRKRPANLLVF